MFIYFQFFFGLMLILLNYIIFFFFLNFNCTNKYFLYNYNDSSNQKIKKINLGTGFVIKVSDEIVHCIGLPNVKLGEVVFFFSETQVVFKGLVINVS